MSRRDDPADVNPMRLFVRHVPINAHLPEGYRSPIDFLRDCFQPFGKITDICIPTGKRGIGERSVFAFVSFESAFAASEAQREMNDAPFRGVRMHVSLAMRGGRDGTAGRAEFDRPFRGDEDGWGRDRRRRRSLSPEPRRLLQSRSHSRSRSPPPRDEAARWKRRAEDAERDLVDAKREVDALRLELERAKGETDALQKVVDKLSGGAPGGSARGRSASPGDTPSPRR